jgi:putative salt-induced outer membrane protein YdiY
MTDMKFFAQLFLLTVASIPLLTHAENVKTDGKWRGNAGAALSMSSGNTRSDSLNVTADSLRATADDKLSLTAEMLFSRAEANGVTSTSANQWRARGRYESNISTTMYGFGGLDFSHDQIRLLVLRSEVSAGVGYHLVATEADQSNIFAGANYRSDQYSGSGITVNGSLRTSINATEFLIGEESTHALSEATSLKQRLTVNANQSSDAGNRIALEIKLATALNGKLSLTVTLQDRYDTQAQAPIKRNDVVLFTGLSARFGD